MTSDTNRFAYRNAELQSRLTSAKTFDDLESALDAVTKLIPTFFTPEIYGRQVYCYDLDRTIQNVLNKLRLPTVELDKSNDNVCVLATRFYDTGGHSKVAADICARLGADRVSIIFTDLYRQLGYRLLINEDRSASPFPRRSQILLSAPTLIEKIIELHAILAAMRPSRILVLCNHMDIVAVAGAWAFRSVAEFIHHADHLPALGATLPFSAHVDLNYPIHLACREAGLSPVYAAMNASVTDAPRSPDRQGLRIATCGSLIKYRHPGRYKWTDYATAALRAPGATLVHIGPVDDAFRAEVSEALAAAGLDPETYQYAGVTPKLGPELVARSVDVFLGSYPTSGGRANLEAMAAGIPTIVAHDPDAPPLIPDRWPLPQFRPISSPDDLAPLLARIDELTERAKAPEAMALVKAQFRRFDDYVDGKPLDPIETDEVLPD